MTERFLDDDSNPGICDQARVVETLDGDLEEAGGNFKIEERAFRVGEDFFDRRVGLGLGVVTLDE